jgi:hypothetical protein
VTPSVLSPVEEAFVALSCPLVSHEERVRRNQEWMKKQSERHVKTGGHG